MAKENWTPEEILEYFGEIIEKIEKRIIIEQRKLERLQKDMQNSNIIMRFLLHHFVEKKLLKLLDILNSNQKLFTRSYADLSVGEYQDAIETLEWMTEKRQWGYQGSNNPFVDLDHDRMLDSLVIVQAKKRKGIKHTNLAEPEEQEEQTEKPFRLDGEADLASLNSN